MAVNIVRKSKNEDEEERRKQLLAQMQQNSQARKDAEIQSVKDMKLNWVDPTTTGFRGATNRIGWIGSNVGAGAKKSILDTLSAPMQSTAVGLQRGANQAAQENSTWDKIKNFGKNYLKSVSYSAGGPVGVILYNATIGRKDLVNDYLGTATKIAQNYEQAQTGFGKAGAIIGGVSSKVIQDNNSLLQNIYIGSQQVGQILGEDKANQATEKILEADTKLHEKNDKRLEELQRQGTLYGGVTRKLGETGQTIGYMTPSIAIGIATGGAGETAGLVQMGFAAKGSTTREAMQQGADLETAERKGVASGTAEAASEKMFGGLKAFKPFKESGVEDVAKKYIAETIEKRISSQLGQTVAKTAGNWLVDVTGETIEELTTDIYNTWLDQATTDPNAQYTLDDAINTAVGTALSTTVLNVGYTGLNKGIQKVYDRNQARANNQESIPEAERTESNGYKENLQEMLNNLDIPEEAKAQIQPMLDSNATINAEEYKDITNNIKTLVKANTQQQIADYGAELTTQYNAIEEQIQSLDNIKPENFKDQESRRFYAQQMNKEFSDNTLDAILATYPENRNGNRTVKQYKEIAKEYGKQMALNGLTFDEVRANTVGAWQYYEPNKNITRYDNQQKKNASFERLNSQVWSEEVYNSYRDTMKAQLDQQQKDLADTANARLEEIQDEENILIDTIDNLKPRIEAVKSSLVQSAEQYGYKGKQISEIQDLMKRRGINAYFDETQFNNDSEGAFYNPKTNEIVFNPNASQDQVIQELAVHEWYHDLVAKGQGSEIQQSVIDFLKNNKDYQDLRKSLENAYAKLTDPNTGEYLYDIESKEFSDMIDEEATAKTLQRVLGNETEIQRLINYKPSLARRIYDAVVDLLNKFTGGRIEKLYWQDVRNKFEAAFNENGISINEEKARYSKKTSSDETLKHRQNEIIQNTNPMDNSLGEHTWINSVDDIKTYQQALEYDEYEGQGMTPDYTNDMVQEALKTGKMTVYSSYPIENGTFVTPSKMEAQNYAGNNKVYSKEVDLTDVAWIDGLQGQYAKIDSNTTTDNQGRTLTKEQQEYFKDSKVRDENGNLLEVYHGTPTGGFTIYDTNKLGSTTKAKDSALGIHLTDNIDMASSFGESIPDNILEQAKQEINREYNIDYDTIPREMVDYYKDKIWDLAKTKVNGEVKSQYLDIKKPLSIYADYGISEQQLANDLVYIATGENNITNVSDAFENNMDLLKSLQQNFNNELGEFKDEIATPEALNRIKELGYDGVILPLQRTDQNALAENRLNSQGNEYIVFNSNQIKNVDNKAPTTNSDIRYSIDTDNQGNTINPGMQEYLKDISPEELVDGKVPLVYHTTTDRGLPFFEFDPTGTDYYRFGDQVVNYYTDSQDMSSSYANNEYVKADTTRIDNIKQAKQWLKDNTNAEDNLDIKLAEGQDKKGKYALIHNGEQVMFFDNIKETQKAVANYVHLFKDISKLKTEDTGYQRKQFEGYVKLTNPYVVDAEERNWNQVVAQSNDFIDELTETVSDETINDLTRLYKESQEISADARAEYYKYDNIIQSINTPDAGYNEYTVDNDTQSMNHLLRRTSLNEILLADSGDTSLGVSFWISLADVLQQDGVIGEATAKNIVDDFKLPEQVKEWIHKELYKDINFGLKDVHNLKELYEKKNEAYQTFDKYRYENSYFKEKIQADESEEGYVDLGELNDLLEQRAEIRGVDVVADEIAQASSVGFSKPELIKLWGTSKTTNDVVNEIIASNQDGTTNYDGVIIKNVYDYGGKTEGETKPANVYVTFNSNQFKAKDNLNPTMDKDIRYSEDTNFDDWANNNLPSLGEGKTTLGDLRTEQRLPVNQPETTQPILPTTNVQPTTESLEIPNEQTSLPLGEQVNPSTQKQRQAYQSIIDSPYMSEEAKKVARKFIGQDTYTPDSNLKQLERADNIISRLGVEKALNQLESNAMEGRTIKAEDIATGDRLIQYYSKIGDSENLQRAIRATAMAGTQAGRSVQAFALLKHQTPQGMAIWIQNSVDKLNSQMKKGQFDFTPEMQEKILNSTEENLQENANEVMKELGQQVPQDLLGKLDSWRYFSMLANPKTHIRNIVGNFAMGLTQQFKSKVAGTIEQVTGQDRTHTSFLEKRNKANTDFAKNDLKNVAAQLGIGESKYSNPKTQIQQNQRVFKSDALEKTLGRMFKLNDNLLEAEDNFGLKNAYVRNLSDYMTANKLNPNTITNEQLQQARKVAIDEALRATFHQESSLASMLNQIENKNLASRVLMGGLVPFKKTPINVAKSGFEYSPAGLAKAIVYDSVQLRKGNINVNEYIDNISKGLTGTGIALVGYALAEAGILKAAGDDDKEDKYKEAMGEQPYSITINGKSYSLDWLAPTGIPLFVGAELNKLVHDTTEKEGETQNGVLKAIGRVTDATSSLLNPMSEMSMISGLTSTIQSFSTDPGGALMNLVVSPVKSYVGQVVPTAVGQVARTMDKYERDTSSTETGLLPKAIDQTKNQIMNKIPGLRQLLPTKKDIWGNEVETQDYFHNAVLPYTKKEVKTNAVDKELNDLYERTGESIYPNTSLSKTVTYEGSKTRLTNQDYNEFKTNYGKTSYKLLEDLTKSQEYKGMTDAQKVQAIKDIYTYANNLNKTEYAEKKGIEFKTPTDVQQVRAVKAYGGKESDYFKYKGITDGLSKDSEKMVALRDSNLSAKSKRAVYSATLGKDDTFFQSTDINVNEYLGYKTANIQGVKDSNGKTISGSKKAAQLDYINNNISGYENRLLLMGKDYKLSRSQQQDLAEYIYTLDNADDLFAMYDKNFTVRDGTVYYK